MKLKNLLIICMIFSFFMAAAVSPAVADFDADVSMKTDFNAAVNLMPSTKDVDATPDFVAATPADVDELWNGKAVVSRVSRKVHVAVSGYSRTIKSSDITLEYYNGPANLTLNAQIAPQGFTNASSSGCDFTLPKLYNENSWLDWIRISVRDQDGGNPVYAWVKAKVQTEDLLDLGNFTPNVLLWDSNPLFLCNTVNITLIDPTDDVYLWWKDRNGTVRAQSSELAKTTDFTISPAGLGWDPNFSISYTNSSYYTTSPNMVKVDVSVDTTFAEYFDDGNNLNILTSYDATNDIYYLDVPVIDTTTDYAGATVYYEGKLIPIGESATVKIGKYNYKRLTLDKIALGNAVVDDNLEEDWTIIILKLFLSR